MYSFVQGAVRNDFTSMTEFYGYITPGKLGGLINICGKNQSEQGKGSSFEYK